MQVKLKFHIYRVGQESVELYSSISENNHGVQRSKGKPPNSSEEKTFLREKYQSSRDIIFLNYES